MKTILDSKQMQQVDAYTIQQIGIPSMVLMERAALSVTDWIDTYARQNLSQLMECDSLNILIVAGMGNNGGDGIAVARQLQQLGYNVHICLAGNPEKGSDGLKEQLAIAQKLEIPFVEKMNDFYAIIVDGIFGIGLARDIEGDYAALIEQLNQSNSYRVAIDIPSGVDASSGHIRGIAFRADATITFGYEKIGQLLYPGAEYCGKVICADIGFPKVAAEEFEEQLVAYTKEDLVRLPKRSAHSNKGTYGKVMLVAGSKNMAGAAYLSATAAYRMGCGLVQLITEEANREIVQQMIPEAVLQTYDTLKESCDIIIQSLSGSSVCIIGPGLGDTEQTEEMLETVLTYGKIPLVLDADGLNVISRCTHLQKQLKQYAAPVIITPHVKEMSRLCQRPVKDVAEQLISVAKDYAKEYNVTVVLKDARTIVAEPGSKAYINVTGNHGMATGGSGDVLSGIIGSLLAQGMEMFEAAKMGAYLHGLYGNEAALKAGCRGMMAGDILEEIAR